MANQQIIFHPINYQPVVIGPGQPNYIVGNQVLPVLAGPPANFTTKRAKMVCPYCGNSIKTNVKLSFNLFKCCIFFLCIFLIIFAGCQGDCTCRDCCCCCCCCYHKTQEEEDEEQEDCCICFDDAIHTCPVCGKYLGETKIC